MLPKVRDEVHTEHFEKSESLGGIDETSNPECHTNVGQDDLAPLVWVEHDGVRVQVYENGQPRWTAEHTRIAHDCCQQGNAFDQKR